MRTILEITGALAYTPVITWSEHALTTLLTSGHRAGGARIAVIDALAEQACCRSALEIYDELRSSGRPVGIASVYRALELLTALDLVQRVDVGSGVARYEPIEVSGHHHHHVVCDDCGRVDPFVDPALERAISSAAGRVGYEVDAHEVVLRGACDDCRAA